MLIETGSVVAFFFPDRIVLIDLSKNLPFFFTAQTNPIKIPCILFLQSDLSDRSDFARSKVTERLDKPAHFRLLTLSLWRISRFGGFFRHFNGNNF